MPRNTNPDLQNQVIYSIFVRNHTQEGTFRAVIEDLDRIRALGVDTIWLMPIHPLGVKAHKGSVGSPYAIRDYRAVNPDYGTLADFIALTNAIHERGMRCIIDVVYNHTSPDSVLWESHPEWFYRRPNGAPGNHVGDWSDIIDLDYTNSALWDYQIETLTYWAQWVDGFRCDVASFVPVRFWLRARAAVEEVRPGAIWLAESVHRSFGKACRALGMYAARDTELFEAFDMEYEYDVWEAFERYLDGQTTLGHVLDLVDFGEAVYPEDYIKLRFLENHDQPRIASRIGNNLAALENHTALMYFLKGATLLYGGQEVASSHLPGLFDKDPVNWDTGCDISPLIQRLGQIKHEYLGPHDLMTLAADDARNVAVVYRDDVAAEKGRGRMAGIFSLSGRPADISLDLADGTYENLLDGTPVTVQNGKTHIEGNPVVMSCPLQELRV